jgi:hypothetical protein
MTGEELGYLLDEIRLSFWVDLTEQDILNATTVGDLFDKIIHEADEFEAPRCLTSFAFFRLRRSLVAISGLDRRSVRPATQLRNLLHPTARRAWWEDVESNLRLRLPDLRPGLAAITSYWAIAAIGLFAFVVGMSPSISWEAKLLMPFAVPIFLWGLFKAASRLPREFSAETFGELVRLVVTLNQQKLTREAGGSTIDQAWAGFRELLSGASGITAARITREMRFPEDLNLL